MIPEHEHTFGDPNSVPFGTIRWCQWRTGGITDEQCHEMRVAWRDKVPSPKHWRELTASEKLDVTCKMWEDLTMFDAMKLIHGPQRAMQRMGIQDGD
jgi:hypothetical protein